MNYFNLQPILLAAEGAELTMADRISYCLQMLILGLGAVFVVLALLWGVLVLSRILLHDMPARRREEEQHSSAVPKAAPASRTPAPATPATPVVAAPAAQDPGVLIALITAAVAAAMAEEGSTPAGGFRVVSFRPAASGRAWNRK